jgi:hypothetical protein
LRVILKPFRTYQDVNEVGEQKERNAAAEDIVDQHLELLSLDLGAGFDIGEREREQSRNHAQQQYIHHGRLLFPPANARWT